jgi:tRNA (cmo5U34)-methyltransferase
MDVKEIFNQFAQAYDKTRRQFIPCFDEFYGTALRLIPYKESDSFHILDLGAGTGLMSQFIITSFPNARITLVDIADQMLEQAKLRFRAYGDQITYNISDFSSPQWRLLPDSYDVVISSLAIHHLTSEQKQNLFNRIYTILTPGGIFINADQALGETPEIENKYKQDWWSRVKASGLSQADLDAAQNRITADKMDPLSKQLAWVGQAGFLHVNCWYSNFSFCVYSGQKYCN